MPPTIEDVFSQIEKSQTMSPKDYTALRTRWSRPGRKEANDVGRLFEWLRVNRYLTNFALAALAQGKLARLALNQYRLTDLIESGPQAGEFLAVDPLERSLCVQVLSPSLADDPALLQQFRQRAQRALGVQHHGIAGVLDFGEARGLYYVVSEFVEGETLEDILKRRGQLKYERAVRIFAVAFEALHALHQSGLAAGELAADCIVFARVDQTSSGRTVRLVNACLPRWLFDSSALGVSFKDHAPARPRGPAGERLAIDASPRPAEDIYRLGLLFRRSIAGQETIGPGKMASIRQAVPNLPDMLVEVLDAIVSPDASGRPATAAAVAKALRVLLRAEEESKDEGAAEDKIIVPDHAVQPALRPVDDEQALAAVGAEVRAATAPPGTQPAAGAADLAAEAPIGKLFRTVVKYEGSDLHLISGLPPMMRIRNVIRSMEAPPMTEEDMERLVAPILSERSRHLLEETGGADFAYVLKGGGRFRVNLFRQRGQLSLVARRVNANVPTFDQLGLPPIIQKLCEFDQGMIIVAGVTGSGKSTTLAAMVDYINNREPVHILTIEDPIEFLFTHKKAIINQREVGVDVADWHVALKHAVRQDPDVILVGEMRDRDTFEAGLHAAETGHLVLCTLHASTAPSAIGRILDLFPSDMHQAMRQSLAFNLKAIICQKLLASVKHGVQRVPANEIMIVNPTIRELIVKAEDKKLPDALRIGMSEGMLDFNESLYQLVARGDVRPETALEVSPNPDALLMAFKGIRVAQPGIL
jgi:twitching motility protein PilT